MQNYCLQANIEKQEKDIISFENFLFFLLMRASIMKGFLQLFFLFNEGKLEIKRSGRFSRSEVITYTTSMRKRLRNEKKGILTHISIVGV